MAKDDIFQLVEDNFVGDSIEVTCYGGKINIQVENPWAGSTDTGFGYTCSVSLTEAQAFELAKWLMSKTMPVKDPD